MKARRVRSVLALGVYVVGSTIAAAGPPLEVSSEPVVLLGVDVLIAEDFTPLRAEKLAEGSRETLRVGLITNPTGVTRDLRSTIDVLHARSGGAQEQAGAPAVHGEPEQAGAPAVQSGAELRSLFGPEHGVRGEAPAGEHVESTRDAATGLPVYSLYGKTRKPTADMLADLDALVFDIQDIGSRSYTYISTMAAAMEAAAEHGKRFVVLDRPNPLGGLRVEGRPLDLEYRSFVGYLPIPYVHGMTVGELARMINGEGWLPGGAKCDLTVVPLRGWRREMLWEDTGLRWIPTSPHVPRAESALFYAATGIMGELQVISEGVGYPLPFELAGAPEIEPRALAHELNRRGLAGVHFQPTYFQPYYTRLARQTCGGVQIRLTDPRRAALTPIQFHIMDAVRALYPELKLFSGRRDAMFDKVCGTDQVRRMFAQGRPVDEILAFWSEGEERFREQRKPYLLYE